MFGHNIQEPGLPDRLSVLFSARADRNQANSAILSITSHFKRATKNLFHARRLPLSQLVTIRNMISSRSLTTSQMADPACCSKRSIITFRPTSECSATFEHPANPGGRPSMITPVVLEAMCEHLPEKPDLYLDEIADDMADFLLDDFRCWYPFSPSDVHFDCGTKARSYLYQLFVSLGLHRRIWL